MSLVASVWMITPQLSYIVNISTIRIALAVGWPKTLAVRAAEETISLESRFIALPVDGGIWSVLGIC